MLSQNIGKNKISNPHGTEILNAMNYQTNCGLSVSDVFLLDKDVFIRRSVLRNMPIEVYCTRANTLPLLEVWMVSNVLLKDMPTEVYCTGANTLPVKEVWMVSDVCGKIKGMKIDLN